MTDAVGPAQKQCVDCGAKILGGNRKRCATCSCAAQQRRDTAYKRRKNAQRVKKAVDNQSTSA